MLPHPNDQKLKLFFPSLLPALTLLLLLHAPEVFTVPSRVENKNESQKGEKLFACDVSSRKLD
jgi:hypothetical protein